jgi:hypothetical protein
MRNESVDKAGKGRFSASAFAAEQDTFAIANGKVYIGKSRILGAVFVSKGNPF